MGQPAPDIGATNPALPNLYLIGAPKAGTTSVAVWLSQHPEVFWSVPKEPFFWATDYPGLARHYGLDSSEAYQALFDSPEARAARYRADGSTVYLYSRDAVPAILAAVPDARFIVCLRNPVTLIPSYHRTQVVALNEEEPDLERAWHRSLAGGPAGSPLDPKLLDYPTIGALGEATERLLATVDGAQVHLVVFDDLARDPDAVWRGLCGFLEIEADPSPAFEVSNPSGKAHRSPALRRLTHRPPRVLASTMARLRQWSRSTDSAWVSALKSRLWVEAERPATSPALAQELRDYFADDVALLSRLVGRDLTREWTPPPDQR